MSRASFLRSVVTVTAPDTALTAKKEVAGYTPMAS